MADNNFTHLPLPFQIQGRPKLHGGGTPDARTKANVENRTAHGGYVKRRSAELSRFWKERQTSRQQQNLPEIESGIPLLLEIDPSTDVAFLRGLGFEIVCEIEEGFIIVATDDIDMTVLNTKADGFIQNISKKCNTPARIYALCEDNDRLTRVLSPTLRDKWSAIVPDQTYIIDIGVSCCGGVELPKQPKQDNDESDDHYSVRMNNWNKKFSEAYMIWDKLKMQREETIENFVSAYDGEIMNYMEDNPNISILPDSFSARLKISGKCLIDLVLNFAYIFEVSEAEDITLDVANSQSQSSEEHLYLEEPDETDPIVCVIDSGIQEEHKYLAPAIIASDSVSLLPGNTSVADEVTNGGHGTRVAGAVLYPQSVPHSESYKMPCWIRNFRVLNENNSMPQALYPPSVISAAVNTCSGSFERLSKIYNHSIGRRKACELKHMSAWAAEIDSQSYNNDVLFIQAAGNIPSEIIDAYWQCGNPYPLYFDKELCRISDPAQSLQALTVGSVSLSDYETDDQIALGVKNEISSFSRSGPGIWDVIKPEVVEYGGTHVWNKGSVPPQLTTPSDVCPELIRKSPEGPAYARDAVGTSFSTPKVAYVASQIEKILPDSPALLYRALIAQSARWPKLHNTMTKKQCISTLRHIGYGIPDVGRATHNDEYRITLITPNTMEIGSNEAHIFQIPIPETLSSVGEDFDVLVEITLSYAANPRRTRRYVKSYLSTWLEWCCSKIGESSEAFSRRIFETGAAVEDDGNFDWVIGDATNHGMADGYSRKNGTLQKDWCIIKSNQLSDAFCVAVRGHGGWGEAFKAKYSLTVSFEAINQDITIYEPIRTEIESVIENREIEVELPTPTEQNQLSTSNE